VNTVARIGLICLAAIAALYAIGIVVGLVSTILHYVFILAIVGGVGYVCVSLLSPRKALGWKSKILP